MISSGSGSLKGSHSRDAQLELAFLFQLFKDEKVLPVAEVLHAGDAVGECVGDGEFVALAALVVAGRRNDFVDQLLRRLAEDAGGLAVRIEVDGSALRRLGLAGDAGGGERGGVGDGDVAVDAIKKRGMAAVTLSRSWRVGRIFCAQSVWSQFPPVSQWPAGAASAKA